METEHVAILKTKCNTLFGVKFTVNGAFSLLSLVVKEWVTLYLRDIGGSAPKSAFVQFTPSQYFYITTLLRCLSYLLKGTPASIEPIELASQYTPLLFSCFLHVPLCI